MKRQMIWQCWLRGETHAPSGRRRTISAKIEGAGDVVGAIYAYMGKRRKSYEWLGVELTATTPLGQRVHVVYEPVHQ